MHITNKNTGTYRQRVLAATLLISLVHPTCGAESIPAISFAKHVRPILAKNCLACHGPDEGSREADLRLDQRAALLSANVIDSDDLANSELLLRIRSEDADLQMPPPDSGHVLTETDQAILERWIRQGAPYEQHWSFVPPTKATPAQAKDAEAHPDAPSKNNPIDFFLQQKMRAANLRPAVEADRHTLARRLALDLIGLPPTPAVADAFVADQSPDAFDQLVTNLIDSKQYGERWARVWLDLARYSDTNGYEKDRPRSMWPYRDWVIDALNADMPFDQFTIEQLAGDMLPDATLSQKIATGFHRNTMLNEEGGIDPLEYRFYAMVDRVATTSTVWMGITVGCAQCHSHKYDPISHTDYYSMLALLNNADEPDLPLPRANKASKTQLTSQIADLEAAMADQFPTERDLKTELNQWVQTQRSQLADWTIATPVELKSNLPKLARLADDSIFASGDFTKRDEYALHLETNTTQPITAIRLEVLPDDRLPAGGPGRAYYEGRKGDFFLSELSIQHQAEPLQFKAASRSYGKIAIGSGNAEAKNVLDNEGSTGWSTANREGERHVLVLQLSESQALAELDVTMLFERHFVAGLGRFRFAVTTADRNVRALDLSAEVERILLTDSTEWSAEQRQLVTTAFLNTVPDLANTQKKIAGLRQRLRSSQHTLVMQERAADNPRITHRHHRGEWLSPREQVEPAVPSIFPGLPKSAPANRLTFARWLVSRDNPLVARVVVNRAWRQLMGHALVRSDGDFGTQAEFPTHPQLLDWLACEFMDQGWSMKWLHRTIVSTAAYRQSSRISPELLALDPLNTYFARGPRHRVDAETVRDIMLSASGLLAGKVGGPSVYPPQPKSVTAVAYGGGSWKTSKGADRYRRSLYTFNKRTAPFAAYTTFDGPSGENCLAKRTRSNTPLQALTLLNDSMYLEMAQALAADALSQDLPTSPERIQWMFRRLLTRPASSEELQRLSTYHDVQLQRLHDGKLDAAEISGSAPEANDVAPELAAVTLVARVLMNLDETITKQ